MSVCKKLFFFIYIWGFCITALCFCFHHSLMLLFITVIPTDFLTQKNIILWLIFKVYFVETLSAQLPTTLFLNAPYLNTHTCFPAETWICHVWLKLSISQRVLWIRSTGQMSILRAVAVNSLPSTSSGATCGSTHTCYRSRWLDMARWRTATSSWSTTDTRVNVSTLLYPCYKCFWNVK